MGNIQHAKQQANRLYYSIPILINGAIAVILGFIGRTYAYNVEVHGALKSIDPDYATAAKNLDIAYDRIVYLIMFGFVIILAGLVLLFIKSDKKNKVINVILWLVPMAVTIIFTFITYIPIFGFES
jgi:uncharacterized membrane protein